MSVTRTGRSTGPRPGNPPGSRGHRVRGLVPTGAALGALAVLLAACGTSSAEPIRARSTTVEGPAPAGGAGAARQLQDAAGAMTRAADFTLSGKVSAGGATTQLAGQFQAPDVVELTITPATGAPVTVLFAGATSYVKAPDGTWKNHLAGPAGPADPRVAFAVLDRATDVAAASSAGGSTSYTFTLPGAAAASIVQGSRPGSSTTLEGTAVVTSGTISELTLESRTSPAAFAADLRYTAVDSSPPVALPAGV
jgi:hypothetical protein